ncbi:MAG: large subunit ribosomal protein L18 [Microgenomates group bacterium LiPW_16]|nr:MAG: large subunit ribosomal protein L18 [Microgenomates group bacterium LiPW_16]
MIRTSANRPRLSVFRSAKYIYGQIIDDKTGKTLAAANDLKLKTRKPKLKKAERAYEVGKLLAEKAVKEKIKEVVFDRGRFKYHGRVKALAEGAREGGLKF